MLLGDIQSSISRALNHVLDFKKWLLTFTTLLTCGIIVVFSHSLSLYASGWMAFFLCSGLLLALGVVLIRGYHDEIKHNEADYYKILHHSWQTLLTSAYFSFPVFLAYLILWILLGIFLFLSRLPSIGDFFGVIFVFVPFLIHLALLLLCAFVLVTLFFATPLISLKGINSVQILVKRLRDDVFKNSILFLIGILPVLLYFGFLFFAAMMTETLCFDCKDFLKTTLQWFFLMIPFTALLAPAIIFFFNFAAEAHVIINHSSEAKKG